MTQFVIHTIESAPEGSKATLEQLHQQVGFLPNLAATMAESPAMLAAFTTLRTIYAGTSLSPVERETVALTTAVANACTYCAAAHSTFAAMHGAPEETLNALRAGRLPESDARLAALSAFTRRVIQTRGAVTPDDVQAVLAAGFQPSQLLEMFVGIAMTTLASQMHHIAGCPVDEPFAARRWTPAVTAA